MSQSVHVSQVELLSLILTIVGVGTAFTLGYLQLVVVEDVDDPQPRETETTGDKDTLGKYVATHFGVANLTVLT